MADQFIILKPKTTLVVGPKQVLRLIVTDCAAASELALKVEEGAGVHLVLTQAAEQLKCSVEVLKNAKLTISLIGRLVQTKAIGLNVTLAGQQAGVNVALAVVSSEASLTSFNISLQHQARGTTGRINSRRVLQNGAQSQLNGLLYVSKQGSRTDTYLSDKALLLGEQCQAKSEPQLEILADDVKASHGASIGRINEAELFYLRSRGLPKTAAESMLVQAFLSPALVGVPLEISQKFLNEVSIRPGA